MADTKPNAALKSELVGMSLSTVGITGFVVGVVASFVYLWWPIGVDILAVYKVLLMAGLGLGLAAAVVIITILSRRSANRGVVFLPLLSLAVVGVVLKPEWLNQVTAGVALLFLLVGYLVDSHYVLYRINSMKRAKAGASSRH
jgi:hypothetical protein